jgi:hypothetical protein
MIDDRARQSPRVRRTLAVVQALSRRRPSPPLCATISSSRTAGKENKTGVRSPRPRKRGAPSSGFSSPLPTGAADREFPHGRLSGGEVRWIEARRHARGQTGDGRIGELGKTIRTFEVGRQSLQKLLSLTGQLPAAVMNMFGNGAKRPRAAAAGFFSFQRTALGRGLRLLCPYTGPAGRRLPSRHRPTIPAPPVSPCRTRTGCKRLAGPVSCDSRPPRGSPPGPPSSEISSHRRPSASPGRQAVKRISL